MLKKTKPLKKTMSDVAKPGKTAPSRTSRPLIITNHSGVAHDPMLTAEPEGVVRDGTNENPAGAPNVSVASADEPAVSRQAKIIQPLSTDMQPSDADAAQTAKAAETADATYQTNAQADMTPEPYFTAMPKLPIEDIDEDTDGSDDPGESHNSDASSTSNDANTPDDSKAGEGTSRANTAGTKTAHKSASKTKIIPVDTGAPAASTAEAVDTPKTPAADKDDSGGSTPSADTEAAKPGYSGDTAVTITAKDDTGAADTADAPDQAAVKAPKPADVKTNSTDTDTKPTAATATGRAGQPDAAPQPDASVQTAQAAAANEPSEAASNTEQSDESGAADDSDGQIQEKTAEQLRAEQLEGLIAARTYALPIGQARKRRYAWITLLLLIILLAILTVDIVLDMGLLTLNGVPHTSFFGS